MAVKIEKSTIIGDILDIAPHAAPLFFAIGMHCLGCALAHNETVEDAAIAHGIDVDELVEKLNEGAKG